MKIGIVGAGNVAFGVARFWTKKDVSRFSAIRGTWRSCAHPLERCAASKIGTPAEAVAFGEVVVLAVPWTAVPDAFVSGWCLRGKIVMSTVNALKPDMSGLPVGTTSSAMEEIAKLATCAVVVRAIPSFAELLAAGSTAVNGQIGTVFVGGNDGGAKRSKAARNIRRYGRTSLKWRKTR